MTSDADEQLLFTVVFKQPVKLHSLSFSAAAGGAEGAPPKLVKVFANLNNADFDDVESRVPTQELTLHSSDVTTARHLPLQFVKFQAPFSHPPIYPICHTPCFLLHHRHLLFVCFLTQNVSSLVIFLVDNLEGGDVTRIERLGFLGIPIPTMNMSEFKNTG